jgi:hypothetical protein
LTPVNLKATVAEGFFLNCPAFNKFTYGYRRFLCSTYKAQPVGWAYDDLGLPSHHARASLNHSRVLGETLVMYCFSLRNSSYIEPPTRGSIRAQNRWKSPYLVEWSGREDLNLRPPGPEPWSRSSGINYLASVLRVWVADGLRSTGCRSQCGVPAPRPRAG